MRCINRMESQFSCLFLKVPNHLCPFLQNRLNRTYDTGFDLIPVLPGFVFRYVTFLTSFSVRLKVTFHRNSTLQHFLALKLDLSLRFMSWFKLSCHLLQDHDASDWQEVTKMFQTDMSFPDSGFRIPNRFIWIPTVHPDLPSLSVSSGCYFSCFPVDPDFNGLSGFLRITWRYFFCIFNYNTEMRRSIVLSHSFEI